MKKIAYIFAAIAAVAAVGCQKFEKETVVKTRTLVCSFDATKTTLDDNGKSPKWAVGDKIKLIDTTGSELVTLTTDDIKDDNSRIEIETKLQGETIYAVYPASAAVSTSVTNDIVNFTTAKQDGSFAKANICVAKENNGTLSFQNATAIVNVKNTNRPHFVRISSDSIFVGTMSYDFTTKQFTKPETGSTKCSKGDNINGNTSITEVPTVLSEIFYAVPGGITYSFKAKKYEIDTSFMKVNKIYTYEPQKKELETGKIYTITPAFAI